MSQQTGGNKPLETAIRARVDKVYKDGRTPFAVTYPIKGQRIQTDGRGITFSLDTSVWQASHDPFPNEIVDLEEVVETMGGWRAMHARPVLVGRSDGATRDEAVDRRQE